ncbi:hypothetical protein [Streptomyces sp. NPDC093094]|uniref:hypothetical protein n=1 Tax=Streptomyces sp. NPDC093094 TaxID=3366026 RepID=UPI00381FEEDB
MAVAFHVLDAIVAPGVTVNPVDNSYGDFELRADQRRRSMRPTLTGAGFKAECRS